MWLWQHAGGTDLDDLLDIADLAIAQDVGLDMGGVGGWIEWKGLETCDKRFVERGQALTAYLVDSGTLPSATARQSQFAEAFKDRCPAGSDSLSEST
ncbi:MAG: hypothetical protein ACI80V_003864 [Rhodothermales bacterium]